jgi:DNA repair exonuclease SbcCD ATPase subunit
MDKTVKIRAFAETDKGSASPAKQSERDLELVAREQQLEEERNKSLEQLKTIVQLREALKQEQAKAAEASKRVSELEAGLKQLTASSASDLARKDAQLDAELKKTAAAEKQCRELQEQLKQEQARLSAMPDHSRLLEAKDREITDLQARMKDLSGALAKIISIAEAARLGSKD